MRKKPRKPAPKVFSRQTLYGYVLLAVAVPTLALGVLMTPNYKRARGWEAADTRFAVGYYLTLVGSVLGVLSLTGLLVDHDGGSGGRRRRGAQEAEDESEDGGSPV